MIFNFYPAWDFYVPLIMGLLVLLGNYFWYNSDDKAGNFGYLLVVLLLASYYYTIYRTTTEYVIGTHYLKIHNFLESPMVMYW